MWTAGYDQRQRMSGRPEYSPMRSRLPAHKMVAIYDYNPRELSPNVDVEVVNCHTTNVLDLILYCF